MTTSFSIETEYFNTILTIFQVLNVAGSSILNYLFVSNLAAKSSSVCFFLNKDKKIYRKFVDFLVVLYHSKSF